MTSRVMVALRIDAPPPRVFAAFTEEIAAWWQPHGLFAPSPTRRGTMSFEPGPDGRLVETFEDGEVLEVGRVRAWEPPGRLVFSWRPESFGPDHDTEVHVRFEAVDDQTRVTVEHLGWDGVPPRHAARHGFPLLAFHQREAEWWRDQLARLGAQVA
ncbi:MAG: SRPBCC domain-containing protein [Acidimicrobiia bacterium]